MNLLDNFFFEMTVFFIINNISTLQMLKINLSNKFNDLYTFDSLILLVYYLSMIKNDLLQNGTNKQDAKRVVRLGEGAEPRQLRAV